ncbi:MAG: hypothetical protein WBQ17_10155, partial [Rhizomicrobium sp.]
IGQSGAITADVLDATASNGSIVLTNTGNSFADADLAASGDASLYDADDLTITGADVGDTLSLTSGGNIGQSGAIIAGALSATANHGNIAMTNTGNEFASADVTSSGDASLYDADDLTIAGADVGGTLTLTSGGNIGQSGAIIAGALDAAANHGNIALTNAGNGFADAELTASGDASLYDANDLTITGATVGGTLSLTSGGDIGQSGALVASTLNATANHGNIALTNTGNAVTDANLNASGDASLYDGANLTIAGAQVGGTLTLAGAKNIGQSGAIAADALDVTASHGQIALTNTGNTFADADLTVSGNASLYDADSLTVTGADVGGTLALTSGSNIGQSGAIEAGALNATANHGTLSLNDAGNAIAKASLSSSGSAALYDSSDLVVENASVGGNLTLLARGNLTFVSSVQLANGSILAVAGWDGATTSASGLSKSGAYGNNGGSIVIGGSGASGDVAVGSASGTTTLEGASVSLEATNGYAQVGYNGVGSDAIDILAVQNVTLSGGTGAGDYAQVGNGGMDTFGNESGDISVTAGGAVALDGGAGKDAYAQIGHGGADADKNSHGYTNSGNITVNGQSVALAAGPGDQSYTQIGNGGFDLGDGLTGEGDNIGNITITAVDSVELTGGGADAYAQIGDGGGQSNLNATASASGTNAGNIDVAVTGGGGSVDGTAGSGADAYVQIGNGGFESDASSEANPANFSDTGTITVSDLNLTGSGSGTDGYAQIGNGDASANNVGDVSGNITVQAGTIVLTDGPPNGAVAVIGNVTGSGTVSGTITGYTSSGGTDASTQGAVTTIVSETSPTPPIILVVTTPPEITTGDTGPGSTQSSGPLEELTGETETADTATDELGQSLDGHKHVTQTVSLIPGVLTEVVDMETPRGIPPADQDFSSWGNEAFWRW